MDYLLKGKSVLVVDDSEDNLLLLDRLLDRAGYKVHRALDGDSALNMVETLKPDLILLDVQMPGLDGFEVCQRLKDADATSRIPVIFLTASDSIENITRGFDLGAVDFISKPFHKQEVLARVKTHLLSRIVNDELIEMARRQSLSILVMGIAHEINTPLGNAVTALSIANDAYGDLETRYDAGHDRRGMEKINEAHAILAESLDQIQSLVQAFKELQFDDSYDSARPVKVREVVDQALFSTAASLDRISCNVMLSIDPDLVITVRPQILVQILSHLILNVHDHAFPDGFHVAARQLSIACAVSEDMLVIELTDNGCGIEERIKNRIFEPYITTRREQKKFGMGLYVVHTAVALLHGSIALDSGDSSGARFVIRIPQM